MSEPKSIGCFTVIGIILVTLKLFSLIDLSWWWVLAPFWVPVATVMSFVILVAALAAMGGKG